MSRLAPILDAAAPQGTPATRRKWIWWSPPVVAVTFTAFLLSGSRDHFKCRQECYGPPPLDMYGSQTFEPGHPWTSYAHAWQWSVQHGLTQLALVVSLLGVAATLSERRPGRLYALSIVAVAVWAVWVLLTPAPG